MRKFLNVVLPLSAAAVLAGLAALNRPETVLSAQSAEVRPVGLAEAAEKPATPPAGATRRTGASESDGSKGSRGPAQLTPEQEQEVLDYLKSRRPEVYEEVIAQREKDPTRYRRTLRSVYPFVARVRKLPDEVARAYESLQQTHLAMWRLAREYNSAEAPQKKLEIENSMKEQARRQFEADQLVRRHRLAELEEQIRNLKAELDQRAKDSDTLIRETVERLKRNVTRYEKDKDRGPAAEKDEHPHPQPPKKSDKPKG
jgi:chromosome segregation ATPase